LNNPADCTRIHFHAGQQVRITPMIRFHGYAALFDLVTLLDQIFDRVFVWITGTDFSHPIVSFVVKQHVSGITVKYTNHVQGIAGLTESFKHEQHVLETDRHISIEHGMIHVENNFGLFDRDRNIDVDLGCSIRLDRNCR
jgi:hypothetical protein